MYYSGSEIFRKTRKIQKKIHATGGIKEKLFHFASHDSLHKARRMFDAHGAKFVLISRFFPGIRFFVSIIAGMSGMNPVLYIISFSAGSFIWGFILVYAGFITGTHWETVLNWLKYYNTFALALSVIIISVIIFLINKDKFAVKKKLNSGDKKFEV